MRIMLGALLGFALVLTPVQGYEPELACQVVVDKPIEGLKTWALLCEAQTGIALSAHPDSPLAKWLHDQRRIVLRLKGTR